MRIGASLRPAAVPSDTKNIGVMGRRFSLGNYAVAQKDTDNVWDRKTGNHMQEYELEEDDKERTEAERIYQAVASGKRAVDSIRQAPKVPYGYLAKDGVIVYNGVTFVCDEKTNSICLGDMTNKKNVLNIPLSGGGHLKVNRDNLGDLAKAIGMFCPEDVNRILRAIHLDTKIQSMQQELEEMENSVGKDLEEAQTAEAEDS